MLPPTPRPTATGRETPPGTPTGEEPPPGASGLVQRRHSFSRHLLTHILISVSHDNVHGVFNFISILTSRSRWIPCGFRSIVFFIFICTIFPSNAVVMAYQRVLLKIREKRLSWLRVYFNNVQPLVFNIFGCSFIYLFFVSSYSYKLLSSLLLFIPFHSRHDLGFLFFYNLYYRLS